MLPSDQTKLQSSRLTSHRAEPAIIGQLNLTPTGFGGWCWCPDHPTDRLVVEVLIDNTLFATMVAAQPRLELTELKIGDGFHGFTVTLPHASTGTKPKMVEARERSSKRIFGRIMLTADNREVEHWAKRIDVLSLRMREAEAKVVINRPTMTTVLPAIADLGIQLQAKVGIRTGPVIQLPWIARPDWSIIIDATATSMASILRVATIVMPLARRMKAELLISDSRLDTEMPHILSRIHGISYVFDASARSAANLMNSAAVVARGRHLVFLAADHISISGLLELMSVEASSAPALRIGSSVAKAATEIGFSRTEISSGGFHQALGLRLHVERDLFRNVGEFEECMDDGLFLADIDFMLKAELLGVQTSVWSETSHLFRATDRDAEMARRVFLDQWGLLESDDL